MPHIYDILEIMIFIIQIPIGKDTARIVDSYFLL